VKRRQLYVDEFKKSYTASLPTAIFFIPHYTFKKVFADKCQVKDNGEQFYGRCTFGFGYT